MIKYILRCKNVHEFESWSSDSNEFDKLKKKNFISCIICGSQDIEKSIMSPRIINNSNNKNQLEEKKYSRIKKDLSKLRQFIETNFENVGDKFHSRVRSVYYDKKKNKGKIRRFHVLAKCTNYGQTETKQVNFRETNL